MWLHAWLLLEHLDLHASNCLIAERCALANAWAYVCCAHVASGCCREKVPKAEGKKGRRVQTKAEPEAAAKTDANATIESFGRVSSVW
jgi:hypothetical protein